jgi:hypothetical protein
MRRFRHRPGHTNACGLDSESEESVTRAAGFLDVSEYRVLEIAYPFWFGREAERDTVDHAFDEYLERGTVPFWARAFIRSLMRTTEEKGCTMDIVEVRPEKLSAGQKMQGAAIMALVALFLFVFSCVIAGYPSY